MLATDNVIGREGQIVANKMREPKAMPIGRLLSCEFRRPSMSVYPLEAAQT